MGRDKQPKHRQEARDLRRRAAVRQRYERLLIVCEGEKTEPHYLTEICREARLSTANVQVQHGGFGTDSIQVVQYAEHLFRQGNRFQHIKAKSFDAVFVVFDRDEHRSYHDALAKAASLNGRLINDEQRAISFRSVVSVPCFELWLLLHFEDIQAPLHRHEACDRLRAHLPGYDKGQQGHWANTRHLLDTALPRATARAQVTSAHDGTEPYTDMGSLVQRLLALKGEAVK